MMFLIAQFLFVLLVARSVDTAGENVDRILNRELDILREDVKSQINVLRDNFRANSRKLRRKILSANNELRKQREKLKQLANNEKKIVHLQTTVDQIREELKSLQGMPLTNIFEGLSTEKRNEKQTQEDIKSLKTAVQTCSKQMEWLKAAFTNHTNKKDHFQIAAAQLPELRFTEVYGGSPGRVVIEEAGDSVRDGPRRADYITVRTDGALTAGRHYWELALNWSVDPGWSGPYWWFVAAVGVRRDESDFGQSLGDDDQSWGVWVRYNPGLNQWRYECRHGRKDIFTSEHFIHDGRSGVTHRLGLLLDTEKQTLTVVDINNNSRLFSFRAVDGSKPLVRAVTFGNRHFQRRFRLKTIDPSRLPETVSNLLHNSQQ